MITATAVTTGYIIGKVILGLAAFFIISACGSVGKN